MEDDVFGYMRWLHDVGLIETANIIGMSLGMTRLDMNGVLIFDYNENID